MNNPLVLCSSEGSLASVSSASARHDCNSLALHDGCPATCAESYEAKWRSTALTTQIHHFDGKPNGAEGLQFPSCVTMTLLQCSDSTIAQNDKFEALDYTNSTAGETCIVGSTLGYELVSGDSFRTLTCVSENESVACLTGSLPACCVTRRWTCTNPGQIGVSEDGENITHTAPLVKQLVQSALSLPTTVNHLASPSAS